ncbi:hypothetical protein ESA94_11955 [Lacibacter luteus]|uniref:Outer membrane protein beta-barrel domain-containing protein n=1 Tax=Lacibacter luteus TaxID=2508719 RepID=A0A4Q1CHG2_9BACT|nr:hypothetical protein [Lacibacter luteus]RXK59766.1 hypothetical protein ESA94_11955 [Lacibacter luteus]
MKKIITLSIIVLLAFNASAQFQKGNKVLGFGLNVNSSSREITYDPGTRLIKTNTLNLNAELGFAKSASQLNGFYLSSGYGKTKSFAASSSSVYNTNQALHLGAGYFARKYMPLANRFFVFGEVRAGGFYSANYRARLEDAYQQEFGASVSLKPGLAYKINERFLVELSFADLANVTYSQLEYETGLGNKNINRNFNLGTSLGLGYLSNIGIGARWIIK